MSSRIHGRGLAATAQPLVWRKVNQPESALSGGVPEEIPTQLRPDLTRQVAERASELERQWEQRVREAHQNGFREGQSAGKEKAAEELRAVIERLAGTIEELSAIRSHLRKQAEGDVVKLSLAIARRILHRELAIDPQALRGLIRVALERLRSQEVCRVRIHPGHAALVQECLDGLVGARMTEIVGDPSMEAGAAVFETTRGDLDASIETQLQEIEQGLSDRLRHGS